MTRASATSVTWNSSKQSSCVAEPPAGTPGGAERAVRVESLLEAVGEVVGELQSLGVSGEQARESVRQVLALHPRHLVTSHTGRNEGFAYGGCVREGFDEIEPAYAALLEAHGVPPD